MLRPYRSFLLETQPLTRKGQGKEVEIMEEDDVAMKTEEELWHVFLMWDYKLDLGIK